MAALAGMVGFSACNESKDDHPVFRPVEVTTEDFLNTPVMANTTLDLTRDNEAGSIHMTCSQPSIYGFAAPVRYTVEMALAEDFKTSAGVDKDGNELPAVWTLPTSFTDCAEINPVNGEVAEGICKILGLSDEKQVPTEYKPVYFRLLAQLMSVDSDGEAVEGSTVYSNVVKIAEVSCRYLAVIVPDQPTGIYVRGSINNWGNDGLTAADEFLTTSERDVYVLKGISLKTDDEFKVADKDWAAVNLGIDIEKTPLKLNEPIAMVSNGPNIKMTFDFEGNLRLEKKGGKYTLTFQTAGAPTGIYLRGDMNGWGAEKTWELITTAEDNVYVINSATITTDQGFKVADKDWGAINYGGSAPVVPGTEYVLEYNGGNLNVDSDFKGKVTVTKTAEKDADGHDVYTLLLTPAE